MKQISSYGEWKSPITADLIVAGSIGISSVMLDRDNVYWLESRPQEKGRNVLVKWTEEAGKQDITPADFNVRSKVHEYGGGAFLVVQETVYFVNFADQCLYQQKGESQPQAITTPSNRRYADLILDKQHQRLICVCEEHSQPETEPKNTIVAVDLATGDVEVLVAGDDFYSSPRLSPDGTQLAYLSWNHPAMPWDETKLWLAQLKDDGSIAETICVVGNKEESINEPRWSPDGLLYFVSDRTDWWNLYRRNQTGEIEAICPMEAEFTYPHWIFGLSSYSFVTPSQIICAYTQKGRWYLGSLAIPSGQLDTFDLPYTDISSVHSTKNKLVFLGSAPTEPTTVVLRDLESQTSKILHRSSNLDISVGYFSTPEFISFPTSEGLTAYAWYYPPQNQWFTAPPGELPPLIVKSHGGPTAPAAVNFNLRIQYWTSRGFGYLDVNYGGSTGFGRKYRQRLQGKWGIVDVEDCINATKYLVEQKKVDPERLIITGSSAGGYTALAALTFYDVFKAGASHYGISDLEVLATDTHKFESHYLDSLIGKYPQAKAIYQARSPIHFTEKLACPIIFFHGLQDKVVPPNQAEMMVKAIRGKGLPVAYVTFPTEAHGFRQAENKKRALEGEFYFYSRVFGFNPPENIQPVEIING